MLRVSTGASDSRRSEQSGAVSIDAFVFAAYFHASLKIVGQLIYPLIYVSLIMGVVGTVSRAGFLTLVLTLLLLRFLAEQRRLKARRRIIIPVLNPGRLRQFTLVPGIYWTIMENTIFTENINQSGNFGSRSALIEAEPKSGKIIPSEGVGIADS